MTNLTKDQKLIISCEVLERMLKVLKNNPGYYDTSDKIIQLLETTLDRFKYPGEFEVLI